MSKSRGVTSCYKNAFIFTAAADMTASKKDFGDQLSCFIYSKMSLLICNGGVINALSAFAGRRRVIHEVPEQTCVFGQER